MRDLITNENAKIIKNILISNNLENKIIELKYKYINAVVKITSKTNVKNTSNLKPRNMKEFYFTNNNDNSLDFNKFCLNINNKKHTLFINIGEWPPYKYEIENMHLVLGSSYSFGSLKEFFSQIELSQALEDEQYLYIVKNISELAGEGAIARINSGLKSDRDKKFQRREKLVNRLNSKTIPFDNKEWLIISKIDKKDLMESSKYDDIYYNLVKDIVNYSLTIEDIIAEDKINN